MTENIDKLEINEEPNQENKERSVKEALLSNKSAKTRKQKRKLLLIALAVFLVAVLLIFLIYFLTHRKKTFEEVIRSKPIRYGPVVDYFLPTFVGNDKINVTNEGYLISTLPSASDKMVYSFSKRTLGKKSISYWRIRINKYDPKVNEVIFGAKFNNQKEELHLKNDSWYSRFGGSGVEPGHQIVVIVKYPERNMIILNSNKTFSRPDVFNLSDIGENELIPFIGLKGQGVEVEVIKPKRECKITERPD